MSFGGFKSPMGFWLGGIEGAAAPPAPFGGLRSMLGFWMGGIEAPVEPPPPSAGNIEPTYFIVNCGRMMNRRAL